MGAASPESIVLEAAEEQVLRRIWERLGALDSDKAEEGRSHIRAGLLRLEKLLEAIEVHPSILRGQTLGARHRDMSSLIETLSMSSPFTVEVYLPSRASVCRALLLAKLNFCRLLSLIVTEMLDADSEVEELSNEVERVRTSAVCNIIAEDLLRLISSDESLDKGVRRHATQLLVHMWEFRACHVVPLFFPALDSVWQAKSHVTISYGTLTGLAEVLEMLAKGCDTTFLECFSRDATDDDEEFALQEFVFNITYEQLQQIETHMADIGPMTVDAEAVASILEVPASQLHIQTCTCEDMIYTFRERQVMAAHRRALDLPGPKRTAEQYMMIYLLEQARDVAL